MISFFKLRFPYVTAALTLFVLATPIVLGQQTDRSGIEGKVVDESGGVLPGVTVTISSPNLQAPQLVTSTDQKGLYRFTALPLGVYVVTYELQGFQTVRREGIRLTAGFIATLDIKMPVGGIEETITVTGESPVVDVRTTAPSTSFTSDTLDTVPVTRTVWEVINLSPGMRITSGVDVGGSMTGTQSGYDNYGSGRGGNQPLLDGVDYRSGGTGTGMDFYHDYGSFEEVNVKAMANDAEMPLSGVQTSIIVKSGGNDFHGGGLFQWEGPQLQSGNVDDELRAQGITEGNPLKRYYDFNAELGGRIVADRLWFYGSLRKNQIKNGVIGYSRTAGPDGIYGTADDEPGENEVNLTNYTVKVTAQPTREHKVQGFYQYSKKLYPERGGSALRPAESTIRQTFKPFVAKLEWTYIPNEQSIVNFLLGRSAWTSAWDPAFPDAGPATYDTVTRRYWGRSMLNNTSTSKRSRWQYTGSYSYYKTDLLGGDHDFKVGLEVTKEQYSRNIQAESDRTLRMQNGVPHEIDTLNSPFTGLNNMDGVFAYFKDSWRIGDRLTLNLGVRMDRYHSYLPEQSKEAGTFSEAGNFPELDIQTWTGVVPRLALSYALTSDLRTVVKASYGRFNFPGLPDRGRNYNRNDAITTRYGWNDLNGNLIYDAGELGDFVWRTGASNRVLNPDVKQPQTDEITATFEREMAGNLSARVSYVYKREFRLYQSVNLARPYEVYNIPITTTDPGPDGKVGTGDDGGSVTYYDYDPAVSGPEFEKITDINTPGYTDRFHNIELSTQKRFSNNWQMLGSFLATHKNQYRTVDVASGSSTFLQRGGVPQDPNTANFFPKDQTWEWGFKASGSYTLPYDIQLAGSFVHQSGEAWAREVRFTQGLNQLSQLILLMEPVGSQRRPNVNLLSFRLEKGFELGVGNLSLQFDLYNALNTNVALTVEDRSGPSFGRILSIVPPRIAKLGVTYRF